MRRYPALGKGRISEALLVEHRMTKTKPPLRAASAPIMIPQGLFR
jgi:hypothetical protein